MVDNKRSCILISIIILVSLLSFVVYMVFTFISQIRPSHYTPNIPDKVDQVELTLLEKHEGIQNDVRFIGTIKEPEKIDLLTRKIRDYSNNWQYDGFTPPNTGMFGRPGPVQIGFYNKRKLEIVLVIGYSKNSLYFLQEVGGPGRYLEYREFKELMNILNLDEKLAYYE